MKKLITFLLGACMSLGVFAQTSQIPAGQDWGTIRTTLNTNFSNLNDSVAALRNDIGSGSGSVTSVALTAPTGLTVSGSPVTGSGTLGLSFTSGYSIPTDANQTNWSTGYSERLRWDGGSTGLTASTGRTSLGATTLGANIFTLPNPSAITFPRFNADNTVSSLTAGDFRTALSLANSDIRGLFSSSLTGMTYTNTTGVFSATAGYAIPTTAAFNAKMDTTLFNTRYTSNYDTTFAAAELTYAVADSNKYGEAITRTYFETHNANADSSLYVTVTRLTDSLTVIRSQIASLIAIMNANGDLVTSITVLGTGGANTIATDNGTLQMLANVEPNTAIDTVGVWSEIDGTGEATISAGGLLTAVANGTVYARYTADDGSGVWGQDTITISNQVDPSAGILINGTFDDNSLWTIVGNWTISGGVATYDKLASNYMYQTQAQLVEPVEANTSYTIEFDIAIEGYNANAAVTFRNSDATIEYYEPNDYFPAGHHSITFTTPASLGVNGFAIRGGSPSDNSFSIDNVKMIKNP